MIETRASRNPGVELAEQLDALGRADRIQFIVRWLLRALVAAFAADAVALLASRLFSLPLPPTWLIGPPAVLSFAILVAASLRRAADASLARHADRQLGLHERLTTAIELRNNGRDHAFGTLQLADALASLRRFRAGQAFPVHVSRRQLVVLALSAASLIAMLLLPAPRKPLQADQAQVQQAVKQEAERITALADDLDSARESQDSEARADVARALREAAAELSKQQGSAEKAVAALAASEQQLAVMQNMRAEDLRQALARASDALRRDAATRDTASRLAQGDGQGAAAALQELGDKAGGLSAGQRSTAGQALRNAAGSANRFSPELGASLRQAGDALAAGDPTAQAALDRAASEIQRAAQATASQDIVEKALAQIEQSRAAVGSAAQSNPTERSADSSDGRSAASPAETGQSEGRGQEPSARGGDVTASGDGGQPGEPGGSGVGTGNLNRGVPDAGANPAASHQVYVPGSDFDRPSVSSSERSGLPEQGEASVDYRSVYATYRDRATAAIQDRYVPLDMKELVKSYFSSLEPTR